MFHGKASYPVVTAIVWYRNVLYVALQERRQKTDIRASLLNYIRLVQLMSPNGRIGTSRVIPPVILILTLVFFFSCGRVDGLSPSNRVEHNSTLRVNRR
jgi:hypothetical protein